jgi:hypothetical protein
MLSEIYVGGGMKKSTVLERHKRFKRVAKLRKMMKEVLVQDLTEQTKMLKKLGTWCIQIDV